MSSWKENNLKDNLAQTKLQLQEESVEQGTVKCDGRRSCPICPPIQERDTFKNADDSRTFKRVR